MRKKIGADAVKLPLMKSLGEVRVELRRIEESCDCRTGNAEEDPLKIPRRL